MKKLIGNAVVGQSGGPTSAINASLAGVILGVKNQNPDRAIEKLYGMRNGIEGLFEERLVDLLEVFNDDKNIEALKKTPAAALGSCRKILPDFGKDEAPYQKIIDIFKKYNIRYFFYIGGNDSMDTVAKLSEYTKKSGYEVCVVGIPKTIDNDLIETDHTPGFGSAAKYVATTVQEIIRDCAVYTTKAVTIIEIMGRNSGWLTATAGLGRIVNGITPDYIYLPEKDFDINLFMKDIKSALEKKPNVVVAISEGIHYADGSYVGEKNQSGTFDIFGHKYLAGSGKALELAIKDEIGCKVRSIELSLPQRCSSHIASLTDICEAEAVGKKAVSAALDGQSGIVMIFVRTSNSPYSIKIETVPASKVANKTKFVPLDMISPKGNNVTDDCLKYLLPLIEGEVDIEYKNGLPVHFVI